MYDNKEWYDLQDKKWIVTETSKNTNDLDSNKTVLNLFDEECVVEMDAFIKLIAADEDNYDSCVYTWEAILLPVNSTCIMGADYIPRRRWYNPDGDYISDPVRYFTVLHKQALDAQLGDIDELDRIRPDLGLSRLKRI